MEHNRKVFVTASNEKPIASEKKEHTQAYNGMNGEQTKNFYSSIIGEIGTEQQSNNQDQKDNTENYFCPICNIKLDEKDKISHTLSVGHQLQRNKKEKSEESQIIYEIPKGNPGYQILLKKGWNERGLGKNESGNIAPIKTSIKNDRLGIGNKLLCPPKVTHTAVKIERRPNLHRRTIPKDIDKMDIFSALEALKTTDEQKYNVTKRHRELIIKRDRIKHQMLFKELMRS